ncbi:hypothetical protein PCO31111_02449 [Pandoraea communis]|uniref:Uncharacterized protein n=1 Tax=Pandoraea communis TaxID=2508297 RepID=A0A5E4V6F3_9BURK|nr:hypothetical protein PCO31111_02449 [Pandoraea communis]
MTRWATKDRCLDQMQVLSRARRSNIEQAAFFLDVLLLYLPNVRDSTIGHVDYDDVIPFLTLRGVNRGKCDAELTVLPFNERFERAHRFVLTNKWLPEVQFVLDRGSCMPLSRFPQRQQVGAFNCVESSLETSCFNRSQERPRYAKYVPIRKRANYLQEAAYKVRPSGLREALAQFFPVRVHQT